MQKRLGMDSILREEKGRWWKNIGLIILKAVFESGSAAKFLPSFLTSFLRCHKILYIYPDISGMPVQTH